MNVIAFVNKISNQLAFILKHSFEANTFKDDTCTNAMTFEPTFRCGLGLSMLYVATAVFSDPSLFSELHRAWKASAHSNPGERGHTVHEVSGAF